MILKHEMERGDTPISIQCYMNDTGVSKEEAREHIKYLIGETWKELNEERLVVQSIFPKTFTDMLLKSCQDIVERVSVWR